MSSARTVPIDAWLRQRLGVTRCNHRTRPSLSTAHLFIRHAASAANVVPLVLALVATAGCAREDAVAAGRLRVGFFPNLTHAAALVGIQSGRFQEALGARVAIDARAFQAGTELVTAIAAGEIDLAYMGPGPAIKAYSAGVPLRVLAGACDGGSVLVSRSDVHLSHVSSLDGRRVTVPRYGNTQDVLLRALLRNAGLSDTTRGGSVDVLQCAPADVRLLFEQRQIDAALLPEPWAARVEAETGARVALDWRQIWREGRYPSALLVATERLLTERPEVAAAWRRTHSEIVVWTRRHPEEARMLVNEALFRYTRKRLAPEVLERAWRRQRVTDTVELEALVEFARLMGDAGYLRARQRFSLDGILALTQL